jgi:hypothetical protein
MCEGGLGVGWSSITRGRLVKVGSAVIELNGLDEIAEYLEERELYGVATMLKRRPDEESAEGPGPTTYLGMQVAAPVERGHERPVVTSGDGVAVKWPAPGWSTDVVGQEPPIGFSVDEVPPNCGGAGGTISMAREGIANEPLPDSEIAEAPVQGSGVSDRGWKR